MSENTIIKLIASASFGGFLYWLVSASKYFLQSISTGHLPLDAFVILVPVILYSWIACLLLGMPSYIFLERTKYFNIYSVSLISIVISFLFVNIITSKWLMLVEGYIAPIVAGLGTGLLFFWLKNNKSKA